MESKPKASDVITQDVPASSDHEKDSVRALIKDGQKKSDAVEGESSAAS